MTPTHRSATFGGWWVALEPAARVGLVFLIVVALLTFSAPLWSTTNPAAQDDPIGGQNLPPMTRVYVAELTSGVVYWATTATAQNDHLELVRAGETVRVATRDLVALGPDGLPPRRLLVFGSDRFGRDLAARLLHGGRISLTLAVAATLVAAVFGTLIGLVAGWSRGWLDGLLMRGVDGLLAIPRLFLLLLLVALYPRTGIGGSLLTLLPLAFLLGATSWMDLARVVRAEVRSLSQRDYVTAARANGATSLRIVRRHVLPALLPLLAVDAALRLGDCLLLEAAVSFLGVGVQPPTPSWGNLIADGREVLFQAWWVALVPGLAVLATVVAVGLVADGWSARRQPSGRG